MSWQDEENKLPLDEQIELMAQDMDRLMTENERYKKVLNNNILELSARMNEMKEVSEKAIHKIEKLENERREAEKWLDRQEDRIIAVHDHLKKTIEEQEQKKFIAKATLQILFYVALVVILFKALTTSLWEVTGFKLLYNLLSGTGIKYLDIGVVFLYIVLLCLALWEIIRLLHYTVSEAYKKGR
ncbi:hypothetical protein PSG86_14095 [Enterococcus faecalis]|uniref:hypothetical protein n=1 Tax=Enterococcus faecalis TaxID=1351 RepID=UPI0029530FAA|nr:hypothetical protein [Enterococcus faecalis]MDV7857653.1 hypothetical protein [Enterococcus faecalis]